MSSHDGFAAFLNYPFVKTLWERRTHRVYQGVGQIPAGTMTYRSTQAPLPLCAEEEAILIAATGCTGLTMPDRPFEELDASGQKVRDVPAKPSLTLYGRSAGSPDNAQATHFIMINDEGTYYLRNLPPDPAVPFTLDTVVDRARQAKVLLSPGRLDVKTEALRSFPAYLDSNRFLSNRPGTTVFLPLVDMSAQYINGLMYILTQPPGARPTFVDDRNFYAVAGVKRWAGKGKYLNPDLKVPLGVIGGLRTQIEADLLLQNLFLTAEALGLGAWIHATITPPVLCGDPRYRAAYGPMLDLTYQTPRWRLLDILRWNVLLPRYRELRTQPIALQRDGQYLIKARCPPNYDSMSAAVDSVLAQKKAIYSDEALFTRTFQGSYGMTFMNEARGYEPEVIDIVRAVCEYIYRTHGRFPAHVDAIHVPGVWLQAHHPDCAYYDQYFQHGLTAAQRALAATWQH